MSTTKTKVPLKAMQTIFILGTAMTLGVAGCNKNSTPQQATTSPAASTPDATQVADDSQDPAMQANLAPAVNTTQGSAQSPAQETAPPPPPDNSGTASDSDYAYNAPDNSADAVAPTEYAPEPPPALPEYDQPPCPGDNYIWTPGYWGYASAQYYWVPGAWIVAPYVGALWTPGYWGYYNRRYGWHHGYWGPHIGFYGGVNYGYGYVGVGYVGGYWHNNAFMYNRSVTRVNTAVVRNVYAHNVTIVNNTRVSYNGGNGGVRARPMPYEVAARREVHSGPLPEQVNHARQMASNRQQWASVNHGRPAVAVAAQPLRSNRRAPAPMPAAVQRQVSTEAARRPAANPAVANRPGAEGRPGEAARPGTRPAAQPNRPAARPTNRPAVQPNRPAAAQPRPATRPAPAARPTRPAARPAPQARPENRPSQPAARPAPQTARPAARPAPQQRPESRPAPQQRTESRPAPQQRPAAKPAPSRPESKPSGKPEERRPN